MTYYLVRLNGRDIDTFVSVVSVAHAARRACVAAHDRVEWAAVYSHNEDLTQLKSLAEWKVYTGESGRLFTSQEQYA